MSTEVPMENDPILIQEFKDGKNEALKKLLDMFHDHLWLFASKLINNKEESEEIVSDTFIKLFKKNTSFDTLQNIKAFLYIATKNACMDRIRYNKVRQKGMRVISISENDHTYNTLELITDNPNLYSLEAELVSRIQELIETLPDQCRKIFKMRYFENMRVKDIAAELGIEDGTVTKQLGIAKTKIRALILIYGLFLLINYN
jgi:RNA polymerase sigma-70 factor (family 1)